MVFLAMGDMYARQAVYALLSLLKVYRMRLPASLHVIVYTDVPDLFLQLQAVMPLETVYLNDKKFKTWKGKHNQLFRTKIMLLQEITEKLKGNIVYVDTDVIFYKRPDKLLLALNSGKCLLHTKEAALSTEGFATYCENFCNKHFVLKSGSKIHVKENYYMWNAGVIGLPSEKRHLLDDVLDLNDQLLGIADLLLVEQLAFSIVLNQNANVKECHNEIFHYCWNDGKDKMDKQITKLLKDTEGEGVEKQVLKMNQYRIYYPSTKDKLLYFSKPQNFLAMLKRKLLLLQNNH